MSHGVSISRGKVRLALFAFGSAVLLGGIVIGGRVWRSQDRVGENGPQNVNPAAPLPPSDSRKESREIEIYYGKTGLLFERWSEKAETLLHGKPLARLVIVVSVITAGACFFLVARLRV